MRTRPPLALPSVRFPLTAPSRAVDPPGAKQNQTKMLSWCEILLHWCTTMASWCKILLQWCTTMASWCTTKPKNDLEPSKFRGVPDL